MNEEYTEFEIKLRDEYELKLHMLRQEYVEKNKKFNVGDFVYNVTGIIKVDNVTYDAYFSKIEIIYSGYKYKNIKGVLSRTKDKKISSMRESHNLKLFK